MVGKPEEVTGNLRFSIDDLRFLEGLEASRFAPMSADVHRFGIYDIRFTRGWVCGGQRRCGRHFSKVGFGYIWRHLGEFAGVCCGVMGSKYSFFWNFRSRFWSVLPGFRAFFNALWRERYWPQAIVGRPPMVGIGGMRPLE